MLNSDLFFKALKIENIKDLKEFAKNSNISAKQLKYYNKQKILPSGDDLEQICRAKNIDPIYLMLRMGILDRQIKKFVSDQADQIYTLIKKEKRGAAFPPAMPIKFKSSFGQLYNGDCIELMRSIANDSIDLIFADPPFNLNKLYPSKIDDNLKTEKYLSWCEDWTKECVRILKPGGSFYVWSLPKWNTYLSEFLNDRLTFRHWIATDIKYSLPIKGRLYPSHYSLLYYCKGEKPNTFKPDRVPMAICPKCFCDLKDYGGYKNKMNPKGINISDVWLDIPPVRHAKYKKRNGSNELSIKLLDRIIEMSSEAGDLVFDPFGGSGTTYAVAEIKKRKWIGVEIGPIDGIIERLKNLDQESAQLDLLRKQFNCLFTEKSIMERKKRKLWITESNLNSSPLPDPRLKNE